MGRSSAILLTLTGTLLFFAPVATTFASVPEATHPIPAMFRSVAPALKKTGVPLLLPRLASLRRYYPYVIGSGKGHYDVLLGFAPKCDGDACDYGELIAQRTRTGARKPDGSAVSLPHGRRGYYVKFGCGASCGPSTLTVDVNGYRYVYGIKAGKKADVVKMAASALR
jgi:hypothetical protein